MQEHRRKRHDIELLRVIAAFAVVWYHSMGPGGVVAYGGLVLFLMLSPYLAEKSASRPGALAQRARRLLVPWAFWVLVFGAWNLVFGHPLIPLTNGWVAGLLCGPAIHLWFLPFIFGVLVVYDLVRSRTTLAARAAGSGVIAAALLLCTAAWRPWSLGLGAPIAQYMQALPAVFLGFFLGGIDALRRGLGVALSVAVAAAVVVSLCHPDVGVSYAIALVVFAPIVGGWFADVQIGLLADLAPLTLGIYLAHPLFLRCLNKAGLGDGVLLPTVTFLLSVVFVWILRRSWPSFAARIT